MRQKGPPVHPLARSGRRSLPPGPPSRGRRQKAQGDPARPRSPKSRHSAAEEAPLPPNSRDLHTPRPAPPRRPQPAATRPAQLRRSTPRAEQASPPLARHQQQSHSRPQASGGTKISGGCGPMRPLRAPQQHSLCAPHQRTAKSTPRVPQQHEAAHTGRARLSLQARNQPGPPPRHGPKARRQPGPRNRQWHQPNPRISRPGGALLTPLRQEKCQKEP
ncbi:hypothetical protein NDU88_001317 [Pleurodeles waltl]|uniref:Uncharacterized protein n=1 Tax=Pleurodeles waltl TaxID=8319 RepID=A0AAV7VA29_PLEWA|nr:hypothetical protein NDU88_001317 [Pleurodeles waltl]